MSLTKVSYSMITGAPANVLDYGADPTGGTNSSTAISAAIATGKPVYFPAGTYLCNVTISNRTILFGDGSTATKIKPFSNTSPAMLYSYAAMSSPSPTSFWNYHSIVRDIGFYGTSATSGGSIGFSFGTGSPTTYTTNAEFANNVQFYNCFFKENYIGVQFPLGNIGSAFYSCGFQSNYYGVYMVNNKTGSGGLMHAGNKYFYNGEMSGNTCAVYCDNTADGFGGVEFTDVIFEANNIVIWLRDTSNVTYVPVNFKNCWNEGNGTLGGYTTATIDSWSGSTKTTQVVSSTYPWIISARTSSFDGGFVTGINLKSASSSVFVKNARVEQIAGVGGQPSVVDDTSSAIYLEDCTTAGGFNISYRGVNKSYLRYANNDATTTTFATSRCSYVPLSYAKSASTNKIGTTLSLEPTAVGYNGSTSGASTRVADGIRYVNCNEFTYNFSASNLYIYPVGAEYIVPAAGWYAVTVDVKFTSGTPCTVSVQNLSTHQMFIALPPVSDGQWHTLSGYAYFPSGATMNLWFGGVSTGSCTWRVSAFQIVRMTNEGECLDFVSRNIFLE